jgi:hypothetical protein
VENFVAISNINKNGQNLTSVTQREISKKPTDLSFETKSNSVEFQKVQALSEKTIKILNYREILLQRSLLFQSEKPAENVLSKQLPKLETLIGKQSSHALKVISRQLSVEPGVIRGNLGDTERRDCGSNFKAMLGPRAEKQMPAPVGLHADNQSMTPSKTASEISRPANEVAKQLGGIFL